MCKILTRIVETKVIRVFGFVPIFFRVFRFWYPPKAPLLKTFPYACNIPIILFVKRVEKKNNKRFKLYFGFLKPHEILILKLQMDKVSWCLVLAQSRRVSWFLGACAIFICDVHLQNGRWSWRFRCDFTVFFREKCTLVWFLAKNLRFYGFFTPSNPIYSPYTLLPNPI